MNLRDLKLKIEKLRATQILKDKGTFRMWKIFSGHLPESRKIMYPIFEVTRNQRTNSYFCNTKNLTHAEMFFFNTTVPL